MADLKALRERIAALKEPDRETDCEIAVALDGYFEAPPPYEGGPRTFGYVDTEGARVTPGLGGDGEVPRYTASLDAALALVERLLPGWGRQVGSPLSKPAGYGDAVGFYASVFRERRPGEPGFWPGCYDQAGALADPPNVRPYAPTAPMAILRALLAALETEGLASRGA